MAVAMQSVAAASLAVRERILAARERGEPLRITGRGAWLDAGHPVSASAPLPLAKHSGIVEYVPGDLTLTARAGTTLAELDSLTSHERQWLPLDPFGSSDGTLGATVATGSFGPLALGFGTPRDQTLGLEAVTGSGDVIRAGGRVVKNVAGFDLTRLFTGSWGTLGAITEVTVRLRAMPAAEAHLAVAVPDERAGALAALVRAAAALGAEPYALELLSPALAARLGLPPAATLLVRLGGNPAAVAAQRSAIARLGRVSEIAASVWGALRECEPGGSGVVRTSSVPSDLATAWPAVRGVLPDALAHATVGRGTVRVIVPDAARALEARTWSALAALPGFTAERLPAALWPEFDRVRASSPVTAAQREDAATRAALLRRIKDTYDPMHLLNPGLLGEGIA
jgi:glycolate oxidase FAD binding subunit